MATEAQIKANRQNALKSTGPRTKEGKETVSQNATKHGLCSCKNVIKGERLDEYEQFHAEMIEDLSPLGAMEEMLAERIVNLSWRLKRAEVFQNAVIESISDDIFHESWNDCQRAKEQAQDGDMSLLLGKSIRRDFANYKVLEQLLVYERRIESSLYKATAELRKIQKLRQKKNEESAWAEVTRMAKPTHLRKEPVGSTNFKNEENRLNMPKVTQPVASSVEPNTERENSIQNNENCGADLQSSRNDRENDLKKSVFAFSYAAKQSQSVACDSGQVSGHWPECISK